MGDFKDLIVFQKAYQLAKDIHLISRNFPPEEKYSLTDQVRRSSRSVVLTWQKHTVKEDIKLTLFQSFLMLKEKMLKPVYGLISHLISNTYQRKILMTL